MGDRGRKLVQLACSKSPEPGGSGFVSRKDFVDSSSRNQEIINYDSSDLDDDQMDIANKMKDILEGSGYSCDTPSKTNKSDDNFLADSDKSPSMDEDKAEAFEVSDEEHPFGSDYSDLDPTYVPDSDENNPSNFQSDRPHVIVPESPNILKDESENPEHFAMLILENILDRVWVIVKPLKRRRKAKPSEWKKNISKARKTEGLSYVTKGVIRSAKVPKPIQCVKCSFKCTEKFTSEEREHLCRNYYRMDFKARKNFILSCIVVEPIKNRKVQRNSTKKERRYSKKCFFQKNNEKIQVCQKFFTATLCISVDVISDAVAKASPIGLYSKEDERGRKEPVNKTKKEDYRFVMEHIEMFPVMESHYCRKDSNKQYSAPDIKSISNMYRLYLEKCQEKNKAPVSESKYRDIFNSEYNLSFFSPKKDLCMICTQYEKAVAKEHLEEEYYFPV